MCWNISLFFPNNRVGGWFALNLILLFLLLLFLLFFFFFLFGKSEISVSFSDVLSRRVLSLKGPPTDISFSNWVINQKFWHYWIFKCKFILCFKEFNLKCLYNAIKVDFKDKLSKVYVISSIAQDKRGFLDNIFLIPPQKQMLWYSLEAPHQGISNEYPQRVYRGEIRKISTHFGWKKQRKKQNKQFIYNFKNSDNICLRLI